MDNTTETGLIKQQRSFELATFYMRNLLCGIPIVNIQEINKHLEVTYVPHAPDYVLGILNLRGRIITVIDLAMRLGLPPSLITPKSRNVIVSSQNELIGFLVDSIDDIVVAETDNIEPPPANLSGVQGSYFNGVLKGENNLIGILDIEKITNVETATSP